MIMTEEVICMKDEKAYPIVIGCASLEKLTADIAPGGRLKVSDSASIVVISDTTIWRYHGFRLLNSLRSVGISPHIKLIPPGESSKTREMKADIEDWMLKNKCLRDTLVVAFGGGVIGDLAGFLASTYMRGVPVVQVPTTLLAMVDSSIGGKTGLDVPAGKNLVGSFHQPRAVYIDPQFLETLPVREISNGMAEVIKAGAILNLKLFELCESFCEDMLGYQSSRRVPIDETGNITSLIPCDDSVESATLIDYRVLPLNLLVEAIQMSVKVKADIVTSDEREGGARSLLNFGHTIGHGIEAMMQPRLLHGECVSIGMISELECAIALNKSDYSTLLRVKRVCESAGLPVNVPSDIQTSSGLLACLSHMSVDKKNVGSRRPVVATPHSSEQKGVSSVRSFRIVIVPEVGTYLRNDNSFTFPVMETLVQRVISRSVILRLPVSSPSMHTQMVSPLIFEKLKSIPSSAISEALTLLNSSGIVPIPVRTPGSKSLSNRILLLAALSDRQVGLRGLLSSDDTDVMMKCLSQMGVKFGYFGPFRREKEQQSGNNVLENSRVPLCFVEGGQLSLPPIDRSTNRYIPLMVNNAGTACRFLASIIPLLSFQNVQAHGPVVLTGNRRMCERPIQPLVQALREQGVCVEYGEKEGFPPLHYYSSYSPYMDSLRVASEVISSSHNGQNGVQVGTIKVIHRKAADPEVHSSCRRRFVFLESSMSSQYVSSILLAAPFLPPVIQESSDSHLSSDVNSRIEHMTVPLEFADDSSTSDPTNGSEMFVEIRLKEKNPVSLPYIRMTIASMKEFGVNVIELQSNRFLVPRVSAYSPVQSSSSVGTSSTQIVDIESDASSASYPAAIAALTGRPILLEGIHSGSGADGSGPESTQGDARFPTLLGQMGCVVFRKGMQTLIVGPPLSTGEPISEFRLKGIGSVNMGDQTDCFLTLAVVAASAVGSTLITGVENQRVKECNRLLAMCTEFSRFGIDCQETSDGIQVNSLLTLEDPVNLTESGEKLLRIHCYDDHRVAMSFACLALSTHLPFIPVHTKKGAKLIGSLLSGVIIDDAHCTGKTYPGFWNLLADMGFQVEGVGTDVGVDFLLPSDDRVVKSSASSVLPIPSDVYIVGMRGAGKTTLARTAAKNALQLPPLPTLAEVLSLDASVSRDVVKEPGRWYRWYSLDVDELLVEISRSFYQYVLREEKDNSLSTKLTSYFQSRDISSATVSDIVLLEGWDAFRHREAEILAVLVSCRSSTQRTFNFNLVEPTSFVFNCDIMKNVVSSRNPFIISCGGGCFESLSVRDLFKSLVGNDRTVVFLDREFSDIAADLSASNSSLLVFDEEDRRCLNIAASPNDIVINSKFEEKNDSLRPNFPKESLWKVFNRRLPYFRSCSSVRLRCPSAMAWPAFENSQQKLFRSILLKEEISMLAPNYWRLNSTSSSSSLSSSPSHPPSSFDDTNFCSGLFDASAFVCLSSDEVFAAVNGQTAPLSARIEGSSAVEIRLDLDAQVLEFLRPNEITSLNHLFTSLSNRCADLISMFRAHAVAGPPSIDKSTDDNELTSVPFQSFEMNVSLSPPPLICTLRSPQEGGNPAFYEAICRVIESLSVDTTNSVDLLSFFDLFLPEDRHEAAESLSIIEMVVVLILSTSILCGTEFVDIETGQFDVSGHMGSLSPFSIRYLVSLCERNRTKQISSIHWFTGDDFFSNVPNRSVGSVTLKLLSTIYSMLSLFTPDILKVVIPEGTLTRSDYISVREIIIKELFKYSKEKVRIEPKLIFLQLGETASYTRTYNGYLSPCAPRDSLKTAPGQLTVSEYFHQRGLLCSNNFLTYGLIGTPIQMSPSPAIQNCAFTHIGSPSMYGLLDSASLPAGGHVDCSKYLHKYDNPLFQLMSSLSGGNLTIPCKESGVACCAVVSPIAAHIGAINTFMKLKNIEKDSEVGNIYGTNTDWLGIYYPLSFALSRSPWGQSFTHIPTAGDSVNTPTFGIILGAGGTAAAAMYALMSLGIIPLLFNRTKERAHALIERICPSGQAAVLSDLSDPTILAECARFSESGMENFISIVCVINTLPGTLADEMVQNGLLSAHCLEGAIAFDVNYIAKGNGEFLRHFSSSIAGASMLLEQGIHAFAYWNRRYAHLLHFSTIGQADFSIPSTQMGRHLLRSLSNSLNSLGISVPDST